MRTKPLHPPVIVAAQKAPCYFCVCVFLVLFASRNCVVAGENLSDDGEAVSKMAARIDALLQQRWEATGVSPTELSSDAEFLRRVYLDLTGVTPRVAQVRKFLADQHPEKRARLIDELLDSPGHATHLANLWRNTMLPGGLSVEQFNNVAGVQNWLRSQFVQNMRYDRIVGDLLVTTSGGDAGPALFFNALDLAPEKLAATTSRIFLGIQIECAQCHDHPFDHWTQKDFWGYAAFFARLEVSDQVGGSMGVDDAVDGEVTLPDSDTPVAPKYPKGRAADSSEGGTRRRQLAIWIASRDNPYLPRAAVNRVWAHLFGRGLVAPVDDMGPNNPPSHPQLLDELSDYFVDTGFKLKTLYRTLANTRAYQLSSRTPPGGEPPPELFAKMAIKPLSAEQLYDSLTRILLRKPNDETSQGPFSNRLFTPRRLAFLAKMESQNRSATEYQAGVPQALTLMNGVEIAEATDFTRSALLGALEAPWFTNEQRVETLFFATLARPPHEQERTLFVEYVQQASSPPEKHSEQSKALGDVLWALLNSAEFAMNH